MKGPSDALGAAFPLVSLADVAPFVTVCASPAGVVIGGVVRSGICYAYLELVVGTPANVPIGDILLAPFGGR